MLSLTATTTVSNPVTKLLYAAIPSTSKTNANTILPIDPATGTLGTPIAVLNNPTRLALSDDGQYLFVAFYYQYGTSTPTAYLQRIDLKAGVVDRTFTLPGGSSGILDMHVVPGSSTTLLVSLTLSASPSENGIALFGDSGLLQYVPNSFTSKYASLDRFTFTSDPSTYYGYPTDGTFFATGTLTASTVTTISGGFTCCDQSTGSIVASDGTLLYTNSGQVWSPKTKTLLGRYDPSLFYEPDVLADAVAKRTFILRGDFVTDYSREYPAIASYDPSTFGLAGALYFPLTGTPGSLRRWSADGFSFLTGVTSGSDLTNPSAFSLLLLVRSSLATPGVAGTPSIGTISPSFSAAGSPALTLSVNGNGFTAASTVLWNGTIRTTTFVNATQLTAAVTAADLATSGTALVSVSSGGTVTSGVTFTIVKTPLTLSQSALDFSTQTVGIASAARAVTLQNIGQTTLSGLALSPAGIDSASFNSSSTCGATLAAGASCNVSVTFSPTSIGAKQASVQVVSSVGTQAITLTGTGALPAFTLSGQSVAFGPVTVGNNLSKTITLQNSGSVPLANVVVGLGGVNAGDFTATNGCAAVLASTGSCTINVTFTASSVGSRSATLSVQADGASTQMVAITGTSVAADFTLPTPAAVSATVASGQPAAVNINLGQSGGFSGTVTMGCDNLPAYASCTFSPATFSFGSGNTATVALSIATEQTVTASGEMPSFLPGTRSLVALAGLMLLPLSSRRVRSRLRGEADCSC